MNLLGELSFLSSIKDSTASPELNGAGHLAATEVGGETFIYVSSSSDNGLQILKVEEDGGLSAVGSVSRSTEADLYTPYDLNIATVGNTQFLIVPAITSDTVLVFKILASGRDKGQLLLTDTRSLSLNGDLLDEVAHVETFSTSKSTFVATVADGSKALVLYKLNAKGELKEVDSQIDNESSGIFLYDVNGLSSQSFGNKTYLYSVSEGVPGITSFSVSDSGKLTMVESVSLSSSKDPSAVTTGLINGKPYLIYADARDETLNAYALDASGGMSFVSSYDASGSENLRDFFELAITEIDGVSFVVATAYRSSGLAIYSFDDDGTMKRVELVQDSQELYGAFGLEHVSIGSRQFVIVASSYGDRVSVFEIGATDDMLIGTADRDRIVGLDGDDEILGRAGNDILVGGTGDDLLSGNLGQDKLYGGAGSDVLVGGKGNDLLLGGAGGDFLLGGDGGDTLSYVGSSRGVEIDLELGSAKGGDANGDFFVGIENVTGSVKNDVLTGDAGKNVLNGGRGDDVLKGGAGNDKLLAGAGADTVEGGDNNDVLKLGAGADVGIGGAGNDRILGQGGNDLLVGDVGRDTLNGGTGNDMLNGGAGTDTLIGGAGRDIFIFENNHGTDKIEDFAVNTDVIDLSDLSTFNSFADVKASMFEFGGSTVIGSGSNSIQLIGIKASTLDADDFLF